jgi:hypothetical protein
MKHILKSLCVSIVLILITSCSSGSGGAADNQETPKETIPPLSAEEESALISSAKSLNITYDDFDEVYVVDSKPKENCPGHAIWIQMTTTADGSYIDASMFLYTQDDINSNIGNPSGVLFKHAGETSEFSNWNGEYLDNIPCGSFGWGYPSQHSLRTSTNFLTFMEDVFSDQTSKFRLQPDEIKSGYRDVKMTNEQRNKNLVAIKVFASIFKGQIKPQELFGK